MVALDAVEMTFSDERKFVFHAVCLDEDVVVAEETSAGEQCLASLHEVVDFASYGCELLHVVDRQWIEVVFHVFLHGFEQTLEAIDELLVAVGSEVEPRVALHGNLHFHTLQCEQFLAAILLQHVLFAVELTL